MTLSIVGEIMFHKKRHLPPLKNLGGSSLQIINTMEGIQEKRKAVHLWVDEVNEEELQSLWERAILKDDGFISPEWEQELERRRETFVSGAEPGLTLEALKKEINALGRG